MSDAQTKAKPYSPEEMKAFKAWGERARAYYIEEGHPARAAADAWLRWDATFCQVEQCLAAVTVERDAYRAFTDWWLHDETPAEALGASEYKYAFEGEGEYAAFRAALMKVYALPVSQPSGNSGELAAPATTKPIAETRMGEPNAIDAEEVEE